MNYRTSTLLFTRRNGRVISYEYNPAHVMLAGAGLLVLLFGTLLYGGYRLGTSHAAIEQYDTLKELQLSLDEHQDQLEDARTHAQDNLDALTLRLGRMQAQMLRLDALGKRLVDVAELDAGEFDFDIAPPVGGPETAANLADNTVPDFLGMLQELDVALADRESKLNMLEQVMMYRNVHERVTPSGRAVDKGHVSSKFGSRIDPFTGKRDDHKGIDVAGKDGSTILAVGDGVVTFAGSRSGYGNLVEVDHGNGYTTRYAHNKSHLVSAGETVRKGQPVALMGSTGRSTGPHVHIEVLLDGKQVNPGKYLNN